LRGIGSERTCGNNADAASAVPWKILKNLRDDQEPGSAIWPNAGVISPFVSAKPGRQHASQGSDG